MTEETAISQKKKENVSIKKHPICIQEELLKSKRAIINALYWKHGRMMQERERKKKKITVNQKLQRKDDKGSKMSSWAEGI